MKRLKIGVAAVAAAALISVAAGCGGSDDEAGQTPADATTVVNTAPQTDSEGQTVTTPAETAPPATTEGGGATTGAETEEAAGDAAAGKTKFEEVCQGCHPNGGQEAGVGLKLAGAGLTAAAVNTIIQNGRGAMPAGLVSGTDQENVVAYVLSIQ